MIEAWQHLWQYGGLPLACLVVVAAWAAGLIVAEVLALILRHERPPSTLPILAVLAAVAPLIGLLGTVMGLVAVFGGGRDPETTAHGIAQALLSTQVGLVVAVPVLFARQLLLRWRERRHAAASLSQQPQQASSRVRDQRQQRKPELERATS
jgi:biopolymer transport protein ExbB/TolQ